MSKVDPAELPVAIGQVIAGRYAVSGILGKGGMGIVVAGKHLELGEKVAIKFLHKEHAGHADRFFREARAAARIKSEHVVRIYDVGRLTSGEPYIVMEHLQGEDVAERLTRLGRMDPKPVADLLIDVCHALAEAHAVGIVHRDLKPANIFMARSPGGGDVVKLLDFGVAKVPEAGSLTRTASVLGSPYYMSPEQLLASKDVDARSDVWSLGIILFELLTGTLPFEGDSLVHLGFVVREKPTPSALEARPDIPAALDAVIARCLAKSRTDRFNDVGELVRALAPFASAELSLSISRIERVLAEGKQRSAALASTMPPPSDEPPESEPIPPTARVPRTNTGDVSVEVDERPATATLNAVSTSAPTTTQASARRRRRTWVVRGTVAAGALLAAAVVGQRLLAPAPPPPAPPTTTAASAPPAPVSVMPVVGAAPPPSANPSASAAPVMTVTVAPPRPTTKPPRPAASASASATPAAPAANCTPPFTIDGQGMRHPKPECM